MASGTKLVLQFVDTDGDTISFSYAYGNDDVAVSTVTAAMNSMITNNAIFKRKPAAIKGAKVVITTESKLNV